MNRDVRQKKSLWCICVDGIPVDPLEKVPVATVPHSYIQGQLRRLSAPLDYDTLRAQGLLAVPTGHTHVAATVAGEENREVPRAGRSLVSEEYASLEQPLLTTRL
eukprot:2793854-Amphidinium_carterae.1